MQQEILLNLIKSISIKDKKANLLSSLELINTLHEMVVISRFKLISLSPLNSYLNKLNKPIIKTKFILPNSAKAYKTVVETVL